MTFRARQIPSICLYFDRCGASDWQATSASAENHDLCRALLPTEAIGKLAAAVKTNVAFGELGARSPKSRKSHLPPHLNRSDVRFPEVGGEAYMTGISALSRHCDAQGQTPAMMATTSGT
jgi:hypothetical protein